MVQEGVAAAAVLLDEPAGGVPSFRLGVVGGLGDGGAGEGAQAAEVVAGQAGWLPAILLDPVRDRVSDQGWVVGAQAEAAADLGVRPFPDDALLDLLATQPAVVPAVVPAAVPAAAPDTDPGVRATSASSSSRSCPGSTGTRRRAAKA